MSFSALVKLPSFEQGHPKFGIGEQCLRTFLQNGEDCFFIRQVIGARSHCIFTGVSPLLGGNSRESPINQESCDIMVKGGIKPEIRLFATWYILLRSCPGRK